MPGASVARPRCRVSSAICRSSAGATSFWAMARARFAQLPAIPFSRVRRSMDSTRPPPLRTPSSDWRNCGSALSSRKPGEIGLGVVAAVDLVLGIEEARHVEIGADILDDDVGRVAPAADRDVAIGQLEAFERGRIGAPDDFDAGACGVRQARDVDRIGPHQIGSNGLCQTLLADARTVAEL